MPYNKKKVAVASCDSYRLPAVSQTMDQLFFDLGYDPTNPLKDIVKPGMRVFIKPNWVASRWRESCKHRDDLYCVITHPAVIEAIADRVATALQGSGEIIIADNPSIDANFEELMKTTGLRRLESKYDIPCHIYDLRPLVCPSLDVYGKRDKMIAQTGDPNGEVQVNLGKQSLLYDVDSSRFRGVFDEREETVASHTGKNQLYTYSASLYNADAYISIPKLKTHQKVGATLNLKGLVGSIARKNQLVHWRVGVPEQGGDEYPDQQSYDYAYQTGVLHRGAWPGNDTIWRMVVDLYHALLQKPDRKYFSVVDGIMAGEGQGPFCPTAKYASVLLAGDDLLAVDLAAARYMGLDPEKIRYLSYLIQENHICLDRDIEVSENGRICYPFFTANTRYKDFYVLEQWQDIKYSVR